jgi:hypothetical protein
VEIVGAVSTLEVASHLTWTAELAAIVEAARVLVVREIPSR